MIVDTFPRADGRVGHLNQILHDDEPDDVVEILGEHRQPGVFLLADELPELVDGGVRADRDDIGTRRHDFAHQRVAEIDDRAQQPVLVGARVDFLGRQVGGVRACLERRLFRIAGLGASEPANQKRR